MVIVVLALLVACAGWEIYCRSIGYGPTLNDTEDLWAQTRRRVEPESLVLIGDSRALFDLDLDELEQGLGKRPIQLGQPGSCVYPVLHDFANDESFHGTIICSVVPRLFFAPPEAPPFSVAQSALKRFHAQTYARRVGQRIGMLLEKNIAFLKQDDLSLGQFLKDLRISNRPDALVPPRLPPYFATLDSERRARMIQQCAEPGPLQTRVKTGWIPLFTPPPPPTFIPRDVFFAAMHRNVEDRFRDAKSDVARLRARGAKIVFVRFPMSGELKPLENKLTPRGPFWDRLIKETAVPGIHFEDYPELASFTCPEWSHLSAGDSVAFSKRLVPHLQAALQLRPK